MKKLLLLLFLIPNLVMARGSDGGDGLGGLVITESKTPVVKTVAHQLKLLRIKHNEV